LKTKWLKWAGREGKMRSKEERIGKRKREKERRRRREGKKEAGRKK